jgi:hypothetical protein
MCSTRSSQSVKTTDELRGFWGKNKSAIDALKNGDKDFTDSSWLTLRHMQKNLSQKEKRHE